MKKINRIKKSEEFTEIIKYHKFYVTKGMVLYVRPRKENQARIGITVKKKIGNAVVRNKVKRQLRMMCQDIYDFDEDFDSIILIKESFLESSYNLNKNNLENIYKKVKIVK